MEGVRKRGVGGRVEEAYSEVNYSRGREKQCRPGSHECTIVIQEAIAIKPVADTSTMAWVLLPKAETVAESMILKKQDCPLALEVMSISRTSSSVSRSDCDESPEQIGPRPSLEAVGSCSAEAWPIIGTLVMSRLESSMRTYRAVHTDLHTRKRATLELSLTAHEHTVIQSNDRRDDEV